MGNVSRLSDHRPPLEAVEKRVASLDDGYLRIATSISKLKPKLKLAGREHQVLDAVIYCTFGWNKSEDKVTNTYLADVTDLDDSDVAAALNVLAERRIITLRKIGGFKVVGVNVNIDQWQLNKTKKQPPKKLGETTQQVGQKKVSSWAKPPDTLNSLTKDNIKTKNTMPEQVQAEDEKPSNELAKLNPVDEAFETTFWCAGMVKTGKKSAKSAFATQFKEWRKQSGGSPIQFAQFLADDIACRKGKQFGFEKLHPTTYLNGKRWEDEKPGSPTSTPATAAVFYGKDSFHADFSKL